MKSWDSSPTNDLGKYLGVPLHHKRTLKLMYKDIVNRIHKKITSWGTKTLALTRRITLSKSVLTSIPLYSMQTTMLPTSICLEVDKLIKNFLWGNKLGIKKTHLVAWDKICADKKDGGIGLKKMMWSNEAFLMKLAYNLVKNKNSL